METMNEKQDALRVGTPNPRMAGDAAPSALSVPTAPSGPGASGRRDPLVASPDDLLMVANENGPHTVELPKHSFVCDKCGTRLRTRRVDIAGARHVIGPDGVECGGVFWIGRLG